LARAIGTDPKNGTARRARDELLDAGVLHRHPDGTLALAAGHQLPNRELRRELLDHEVASGADFADMEQVYQRQRASLLADYKRAQLDQIEEAVEAVEQAAGNAVSLARITVAPVDPLLVAGHLQDAAAAGSASARSEFVSQIGDIEPVQVNPTTVNEQANERAGAVVVTLANGLSTAAAKKAAAVSTLEATAAGQAVRSYLLELSDAELELQLGGATMQAYNAGRKAFMRAQEEPPVEPIMARAEPGGAVRMAIYASEVMDENTCGPCADIDGTEYDTLAEAEEDYPTGGYVECEGGLRCRGTLVAVYGRAGAPPPAQPPVPIPEPPVPAGPTASAAEVAKDAVAGHVRRWEEMTRSIRPSDRIHGEFGLKYAKPGAEQALEDMDRLLAFPADEGVVALEDAPPLGQAKGAVAALGAGNETRAARLYYDVAANEQLADAAYWRTATSHELGHRLDNLLALKHPTIRPSGEVFLTEWSDPAKIAQASPELADLMAEVGNSAPIRFLSEPKVINEGWAAVWSQGYRNYLLEGSEQFARVFEHFIARELGLERVRAVHRNHKPGMYNWTDEEWAPIREKMVALLKANGIWKGE
jgi:hypothetical protein